MSDFFTQVANGVFEQGVNYPTFIALNVALFAVLLSLIFLLAFALSSSPALVPHVLVLIFLATGLWGLMIWLIGVTGLAAADTAETEQDTTEQQLSKKQE